MSSIESSALTSCANFKDSNVKSNVLELKPNKVEFFTQMKFKDLISEYTQAQKNYFVVKFHQGFSDPLLVDACSFFMENVSKKEQDSSLNEVFCLSSNGSTLELSARVSKKEVNNFIHLFFRSIQNHSLQHIHRSLVFSKESKKEMLLNYFNSMKA